MIKRVLHFLLIILILVEISVSTWVGLTQQEVAEITLENVSLLTTKASLSADNDWIYDIAFSPDSKSLVVAATERPLAGIGGSVNFWDLATLERHSLTQDKNLNAMSLTFNPDGQSLAIGNAVGDISIWEISTGKMESTLEVDTAQINGLAFSPDGTLIASVNGSLGGLGGEYAFRLFDIETHEELISLPREGDLHPGAGVSITFSPDGSLVAVGLTSGIVQLWDVNTGKLLSTLEGHSFWVFSVEFNPDGTKLVSGSGDGEVRLWDVDTGKEVGTFNGGMAWDSDVVFNSDGTLLATSGADGNVHLWDAGTLKETAVLEGHEDKVASLAFSPDGTLLASGGTDGTVRLWGVP